MNKELASKFLSSINHERDQDIQTTSRLLTTLSIQQLVQNGLAINGEIQRGDIKVGDIVLIRPTKTKTKNKSGAKSGKASDDSNGEQVELSLIHI